jgi:hypothetical protein
MKKEIIVIDDCVGDKCVYDISLIDSGIEDKKIELKYSDINKSVYPEWKNRVIVEMNIHGNGVNVEFASGKKIEFDFAEIIELLIVLNVYNNKMFLNHEKHKFYLLRK